MDHPLVSIIIPTFARAEYLATAIQSVLNQNYPNFQLIVVDDNHPESVHRCATEKVIQSVSDSRIKYIKHESNKGANAARNTGFKNSNGSFIGFLDDDDEFKESKISSQIAVAKKFESRRGLLIFVGAEIISSGGSRYSYWIKNRPNDIYEFESSSPFTGNLIGSNSFVLVDRESFQQVGGYDEGLSSCQDWDLWIKLAMINIKIVGIAKPLVKYHERDGIIRITNDYSKRVNGHLEILRRYENYIISNHKKLLKPFYRYIFYQLLPINRDKAVYVFKKQMRNGIKGMNFLSLLLDFSMIYIVRSPKLYQFARKIKHLR